MASEFIFVYGTLRKALVSSMAHVLTRHCEYVSLGEIQGRLYDLGQYPGAIESLNLGERVKGEIYRITHPELALPVLDDYEECSDDYPQPHEYLRRKITVRLPTGEGVLAWVYLYNHDVSSLTRIELGDYVASRLCASDAPLDN